MGTAGPRRCCGCDSSSRGCLAARVLITRAIWPSMILSTNEAGPPDLVDRSHSRPFLRRNSAVPSWPAGEAQIGGSRRLLRPPVSCLGGQAEEDHPFGGRFCRRRSRLWQRPSRSCPAMPITSPWTSSRDRVVCRSPGSGQRETASLTASGRCRTSSVRPGPSAKWPSMILVASWASDTPAASRRGMGPRGPGFTLEHVNAVALTASLDVHQTPRLQRRGEGLVWRVSLRTRPAGGPAAGHARAIPLWMRPPRCAP